MTKWSRRKLLISICIVFIFASCLVSVACRKAHNHDFRVRGVNLGGWLLIEGWITPSLIDGIPNKELLDGISLRLKSVTAGKYLCPGRNGGRIVLTDQTKTLEPIFRLWRINETNFHFRLYNKKFMRLHTAKHKSYVVPVSKSPGRSETFQILKNKDRIRIKAPNGFFLQVNKEGRVTADFKGDGRWGDDNPSVFEMIIGRKFDGEFQVTNGYGELAQKVMRKHWKTFITKKDFKFMSRNGINAVRIPVGWWIASDPTPPAPYVGGSLKVLDKAFSWAKKYGMKVIIDLHAAPGSQTMSAVSSSRDGFVEWGETDQNIQETVHIIDFLTARYAKHPSLYAVELLNEPCAPYISLEKLTKYYRAGYKAVRKHSSTAYVLLSNRMQYGVNPVDPSELLPLSRELKGSVIDVHYYHIFMDVFKKMNHQQNIDFLHTNTSKELDLLTKHNEARVFVGEWATEWATANLGHPNLSKATVEDYKIFGKAQLHVYGKATFGWAYWTLKCPFPHLSLEWMIKNGYINLS